MVILHKQRGFGFYNIFLLLILVFVTFIGFKITPAYHEASRIYSVLHQIVLKVDLDSVTSHDIVESFDKLAIQQNIISITGADLTIEKNRNSIMLSADYEAVIPFISNTKFAIAFKPSVQHER